MIRFRTWDELWDDESVKVGKPKERTQPYEDTKARHRNNTCDRDTIL